MTTALTVVLVDDDLAGTAAALLVRFFAEEGFAGAPATIAANLEAMRRDPSCWAAVGLLDRSPVGVATAMTMRDVEHARVGEIGDLYVLPEARGRGMARALIDAATAWCRAVGCSAVLVTITPEGERAHSLSRFYATLGFEPTERMTAKLRLD